MSVRPGLLALEDGTIFSGTAFGAGATVTGEICFNTGLTGYQEVLTDPSYHGQIVTMTAPHIGNTGTNPQDDQARRVWPSAFVTRAACPRPSSWRATESLDGYLTRHAVPGLSEVDTRRLTRHIRSKGAMRAALSTDITDADELIDRARRDPGLVGRDLVTEVTTDAPYRWTLDDVERRAVMSGALAGGAGATSFRDPDGATLQVAAFDFGVKTNILDLLAASGFEVTVVPADTPAEEILAGDYDGVFLSNGPGDPEPLTRPIETVRALLGRMPIFGICLGHQLLGLALGARTFKLPFGHRGANHPVKRLDDGAVEITCQNHGFAVDEESLERTAATLSHVNLNDGTVEGMEVPGVAFSVQYHPEAGPGPHDARYLFGRFRELMTKFEARAPLEAARP